jgi:hypothetical protein
MNIIEIPFEIMNLDDQQSVQPVINALIGEDHLRLIVDTGASRSCLSKKTLKPFINKTNTKADLVIGIGKRKSKNKFVQVPDFKIGELEINDYAFLCLQLTPINKMLSYLGIEPIDGLLGSDILYTYKAVIDYNSQKIFFHKPEFGIS